MGIAERIADEFGQFGVGLTDFDVLGDVLGGVAPNEAEVRTGLELDGPHREIFKRGIRAAVFTEGQFDQLIVGDGRLQRR